MLSDQNTVALSSIGGGAGAAGPSGATPKVSPCPAGRWTNRTPPVLQPVVRTHPITGRKAIYVDPAMVPLIDGLPEDESRELLEFLFEHQAQEKFQYEHVWRPGDLVMWDNRCSIHARTDFPETERRKLRRLTIKDEHPVIMGEPPVVSEVTAE